MFEKEGDSNFMNNRIIINGDSEHYIHLIAQQKNFAHIDIISNELLKLQK